MYQNLLVNPVINGIWCVSYETLQLNENTNRRCNETFPQGIPNNAVIIYSSSDNGIVVLGYYVLTIQNITESHLYNVLRDFSINMNGVDHHQSFLNADCYKIEEWVFDNSLNNKQRLFHIFNNIVSSIEVNGRLTFLWCDSGFNEIVYYPINNDANESFYPFAENYFTIAFFNIANEQP